MKQSPTESNIGSAMHTEPACMRSLGSCQCSAARGLKGRHLDGGACNLQAIELRDGACGVRHVRESACSTLYYMTSFSGLAGHSSGL